MSASFVQTIVHQTVQLDLRQGNRQSHTFTALANDLFLIVIKMREAEDLGSPHTLHKLIDHYFGLFRKNAECLGRAKDLIDDATYALVALIDETVLSIPGSCRDHWLSAPLQLEYFGHATAGTDFFRKLDKRMSDQASPRDLLELYHICLSLGFEGKYKLGDHHALAATTRALGARLKGGRPITLSPRAFSTEMASGATRGSSPLQVWITGLIGVILLSAWFLLLRYLLVDASNQLLLQLQQAGRG